MLGLALALADILIVQGRLHEAMSTYGWGLNVAAGQAPLLLRGVADMHVGKRAPNDCFGTQGDGVWGGLSISFLFFDSCLSHNCAIDIYPRTPIIGPSDSCDTASQVRSRAATHLGDA